MIQVIKLFFTWLTELGIRETESGSVPGIMPLVFGFLYRSFA